jgi:hypothetical protein
MVVDFLTADSQIKERFLKICESAVIIWLILD